MATSKERMDAIDERLDRIEVALGLRPVKPPGELVQAWASITSWLRVHKTGVLWVIGIAIPLAGWTYNGHIENEQKAFDASVDSRVNTILTKPDGIADTLKTVSKTADRIDTSLNDLKPFIHDVVDHQFEGASRLSAQALSERLPAVNDLLSVARDEHLPLDRNAASTVGKNLTQVDRDIQAYWPTAGRLISASFKDSNPSASNEVDCFAESFQPTYTTTGSFANSAVGWTDCTLRLDDIQGFTNSYTYKERQRNLLARDEPLELRLRRVKIVYTGGQPIPFIRLEAIDCTFEFSLPVAPAGMGQALVEALLSDFTKPSFTVNLAVNPSAGG